MLARRFRKIPRYSLSTVVLTIILTKVEGDVIPVTNLGDPCTKASECEEMVADSTCVFNTCRCKEGFEQIGDIFCDFATDDSHYNLPSRKSFLTCNKPSGCDSTHRTCETKFTRRLLGLRDSMKVTPGSVLSGFCGLNIQLNFSKADETNGDMHTVNTLCYVYESPYGSFRVAEIKVKEPPRKYPGSVNTQVACTTGKDSCNQYRFSGFVVGFFAGVPQDCLKDWLSSSSTTCPDLRLIVLTTSLLLFAYIVA